MRKLLLLCFVAFPAFGQGVVAPFPYHQFFDNNGDPCNACQLFTYIAGTSTKLNTYTSEDLSVAQSNPIVLNSAGRPGSPIFLDSESYKFVLAPANDTDPPTSPIWTVDEVSAPAAFNISLDVSGTAGESLTALDAVYVSDGSGGLTAGRWYKTDADNDYSSTTANALGIVLANASASDTINVRLMGRVTGMSGLSTGSLYFLSATAGAITTSAPTLARPFGVPDSATSFVMSQFVRLPFASATVNGAMTITTQTLAGAKTWTGAQDFDSTVNVDGAFTNTSSTAALFSTTPTYKGGTSGAGGFSSPVSGVICADNTARTTSSAGVETDLTSCTVEANTIQAANKKVRLTAFGKFAATGNNKRLRVYWAGTLIYDTGNVATNNEGWRLICEVARTSATNAQSSYCTGSVTSGTLNSSNDAAQNPLATIFDNLAGDTTGDITFKTTAEDTTAAAGTTQTSFNVEIVG